MFGLFLIWFIGSLIASFSGEKISTLSRGDKLAYWGLAPYYVIVKMNDKYFVTKQLIWRVLAILFVIAPICFFTLIVIKKLTT
mgnify:CR=1 FL=1